MKSRRFHLIIFLLLLLSTAVAVLMHNRAALQWTWRQVEAMTNGIVTAQRIDGVLAGPISVEGLRITLPSTDITIPAARADWHPGRLLLGRLSVIEAQAAEVIVDIHPTDKPAPTPRSDGVSAPLTMLADAVAVDHLVIRYAGHNDIALDNIVLEGAQWRGDRVWVDRLKLDSPWGSLDTRGYFASRTGTTVDLQTRYRPNPAWFASPLELTGQVKGTLGHPRFTQQLSGISNGQINGEIVWSPGVLHWQAVADVEPFSLQKLRTTWRPLVVGGHLEGSGDFRRNELRGTLALGDEKLGRWQGKVSLKQDREKIEIVEAQLRGQGHSAQIDAHGKLSLAAAPDYVTDADLDLRWRDVAWPVAGRNEKVRSNDGTAHVSGGLRNYQLTTDLALATPNYPATRWQVTGAGDLQHFSSPSVQLQGLNGTASGEASVIWSPHLQWHAHLTGKGLDPGQQWKQWPGRLDIDISSEGSWQKAHTLNIDVHSLQGSLRGYPLTGKGRLDYLDGKWSLAALQVNSGTAQLSATGPLVSPWGLSWSLDAPQLAQLLPQVRGRVHASGTISGSGRQPRITLDAAVAETLWKELRLRSATLKADIDLAAQTPWQLRLRADDARWGEDALLAYIDFQGDGTATAHQLGMEFERSNGHSSFRVDGDYHDGEWRGTLHSATWSGRDGETLQQEAPAQFVISATQQSLASFCLKGDEARGCIDYQPDPAGGHLLSASLTALPMEVLELWLPRKDIQVGGKVFANGHARIIGGLQEVALDAHVEDGSMHYEHPLGRTVDLHFRKFVVSLLSKESNSQAVADIQLTSGDSMHLEGRLPGWSAGMPLPASQPVAGTATLSMRDLSWMTLVVPEILDPKGVISANLALGGTAGDPRLTGTLALEEGSVSIPRAGLSIRNLALAARSPDGVSLQISGAANSGPGWVTIEGNLRGESLDKWRSEFLLRGERFESLRLPSVHLLASPEIRATIQPNRLDVDGVLHVPEADIKLPEFPTVVRKSSDVVIVNGGVPVTQAAQWKINSRITLRMGDYVRLEGYGFKGRIAGQLTITEKPDSLASGQGELSVYDARYKAYGQDLNIDRGRLLFANSPIDNPALDVRASRKREEVTVGVNITGRLQSPELRLFSIPAMEESDALAYLVLGHPLRSASSSEATSVSAAATSLGLVGGERIAQAIGGEFGVDEVSVGSEYSQNAALLLGKYLSPRLYLQYAVVFSDALNVTRLRYELTNHWYIKLESGEQQSADILYTFER